jgi:hypothetical protein
MASGQAWGGNKENTQTPCPCRHPRLLCVPPQLDRAALSWQVADRRVEWRRSERDSMRGKWGWAGEQSSRMRRRHSPTHRGRQAGDFPLSSVPSRLSGGVTVAPAVMRLAAAAALFDFARRFRVSGFISLRLSPFFLSRLDLDEDEERGAERVAGEQASATAALAC